MFNKDEWDEFIRWHKEKIDSDPVGWLAYFARHYHLKESAWCLRLVNDCGGVMMARGKGGKSSTAPAGKSGWTDFVEISLAGHDEETILRYLSDADEFADAVAALCEAQYRVAVSYNAQNDAFIASLTCRDESSPNTGATVTAFAGTWVDALRVVLYKHYEVARGNWRSASSKSTRPRFG